jgi:hypothetical protein
MGVLSILVALSSLIVWLRKYIYIYTSEYRRHESRSPNRKLLRSVDKYDLENAQLVVLQPDFDSASSKYTSTTSIL